MKKHSNSESGVFTLRLASAILLCVGSAFLAMFSFASTPSSGTLTDTNSITYQAGPFFQANASPVFELDSGPRCDSDASQPGSGTFPCDIFKLTLNLPSGYAAAHPKAVIRVVGTWTDPGTGQSTYGIYMFKTPRNDCQPNDCTQPDGSQQADAQAINTLPPGGSPNPQVVYMAITQDTATYTIMIDPNAPQGETLTVKIDVLPGSPGALTPGFGGPDPTTPGVPRYLNFYAPKGSSAQPSSGEFNIGYNPASGRIMTMNSGPIWRITPPELLKPALPECCEGLWEDKSSGVTDTGLDPILWTDQKVGRTFASNSTAGANAVYAYSDNDGDNWTPVGISPPNGGADHETIGSGPYPASVPLANDAVNHGRAVYYCSQDVVGPASCQRSDDFGASYGPGVFAYNGQGTNIPNGSCGGLHGHLHVAPDGTVWLPVNQCSNTSGPRTQGGAYSTDAGNTWVEFKVPNALSQAEGADPSIGIDNDGTVYYSYVKNEPVAQGQPPEGHAHVAVGKLDPTATSTSGIKWLNDTDIGTTHGIRNAAEIEAVGGSSGRAAVGFIGTNLTGDYQQLSFPGQWYAFIATTYDQGKTWVTVNATPNDPVQNHTGIWQQGGAQTDRNLLDFNEITVDKNGRVLYGYSDGCVTAGCIAGTSPNDFVAWQRVARQSGGKTLFASFDGNTDTTAPVLAKAPCLSGTRDVTGSHLAWKVPDNGGSDIVKYFIYRGTTAGGEDLITPIGAVSGTSTTYTDATADPTVKDYFYEVRAVTKLSGSVALGALSNEVDLKVSAIVIPPAPFSCSGTNVVLDAAGDAHDPAPGASLAANTDQADITAISFSSNAAKKLLTTKMTVKNLSATPSAGTTSTIYWVAWTGPDGKMYATRHVEPDAGGTNFTYGQWDGSSGFVSGTTQSTTGSVTMGPNGTISVDVPLSAVGNPTIPIDNPAGTPAVKNPYGIVFGGIGANGSGLFFTSPMDRAPDTGGGQSWAVCLPANAPPVAVLKVTPDHGPAPLTVTLDGSASTDPDPGDSVASYTFDFGDGSGIVTQSSPTITHTYQFAGEYPARLSVNDTHGLASTNLAIFPVEVNAVLRNISTRGNVQTGDNLLIGGFIVTGNQPRSIALRAIGPSLAKAGVAGALQDPTLELHDSSGKTIATNDNWKVDDASGSSQQTSIQGSGLAPSDDRESALVRTLDPGNYTAIVRGKGGSTGIALVEAYDLDPFATSKLANISTRGAVASGDNVMIGGFIVGPQNAAPATVLIRGLGPSLTAQGVPNAMQDPTLQLKDANGNTLKANDNWKDSQQSDIQNTGIPPSDDRESAMVTDIAPGNYTAILAGKNNTGGNALVEIYSLQ